MTDTELQEAYRAAIASRGSTSRTRCPSAEDLLALVERSGPEEARLETLDHVMSCADCHREMALLQAIHTAQPRRAVVMPRHWLAAAGLLIALGAGTLLTRSVFVSGRPDLVRGTPTSADEGVAIVAPTALPAGGLHTLTWHSVPRGMQYTVEVLDPDGRVLFSKETSDTVATVGTLPSAPASWWVRATLSDGTERRSDIVKLK
jgi:hypothetical protein